MQFVPKLVAFALFSAVISAQSVPVPYIEINDPRSDANRTINVTFDGFSRHGLAVQDRGMRRELTGFLLVQFLETAGWSVIPEDQRADYVVRLDGDSGDSVSLLLSEALRRSLDNRAWLVPERGGAQLVVAGAGDVLIGGIPHVRRVRVTRAGEPPAIREPEFERLSMYERAVNARILWKTFARIDGVPLMIATWYSDGRHGKSAVLLSEHVARWDDRRVVDFLAGAALGIDSNVTIARGSALVVVPLHFPM